MAGTGGNGGGAMVCARRLMGWGYKVKVGVSNPQKLKEIPAHQYHILQSMGAELIPADRFSSEIKPDLIIDGIIGYSLSGNPVGHAASLMEWANESDAPVLALDTPSGVDLSTGIIHAPVINAEATMTLALPKVGLFNDAVKSLRGDLYLGDISVPSSLYSEPSLGLEVDNIFRKGDLLRLD